MPSTAVPSPPTAAAKTNPVTLPPAEVRKRIKDDHRRRKTRQGLYQILGTGSLWAVTLAGVAFLPWWAAVPLALVNGLSISMLFVVGHDAAHGSLFPRRWMNKLAGRVGLLPALHPCSAWVHSHNRIHHSFTNVKEKESSFPPLTLAEYRALPGWHRWLTRRYRTWYGLGLYYFLDVWAKWEMFPSREHQPKNRRQFRIDQACVLAFAAVWVGGLWYAAELTENSPVWLVFIGFVVPQMVWNYLIGFIIFQQHTHPRVPWYSEKDGPSFFQMQVMATPYIWFPAFFRWVMRHIMEHTAHHTDPLVPLYELPGAQQELAQAYRKHMVRVIWTRKMFLDTLRRCRLYDFENHRWLDYDGTPTTGTLYPPSSGGERGA